MTPLTQVETNIVAESNKAIHGVGIGTVIAGAYLMTSHFSAIFQFEVDFDDFFVQPNSMAGVSSRQGWKTNVRTDHGSSEDPGPGGCRFPPAGDPFTFILEYSKVVYERPKPNSKRGAIFA